MSIQLHSPSESQPPFEITNKPIAKPRTNHIRTNITNAASLATTHNATINTTITSIATTVKNTASSTAITQSNPIDTSKREPIRKYFPMNASDNKPIFEKNEFKTVSGARKLKEHELSYFGLGANLSPTTSRKLNNETITTLRCNMDGKLFSDKPDLLLNHTPIPSHATSQQQQHQQHSSKHYTKKVLKKSEIIENVAPIYENISYDRTKDLKRDEQNLKELNETADEINKVFFFLFLPFVKL